MNRTRQVVLLAGAATMFGLLAVAGRVIADGRTVEVCRTQNTGELGWLVGLVALVILAVFATIAWDEGGR